MNINLPKRRLIAALLLAISMSSMTFARDICHGAHPNVQTNLECVSFAKDQATTSPLVISLSGDSKLAVYDLERSTGKLTLRTHVKTNGSPGAMCFDQKRGRLYVVLKKAKSIAAYNVGEDSELKLLGETNVSASGSYLNIDPAGNFLLSAYYGDGQVMVHRIKDDGSLDDKAVQTQKTDANAHAIVFDQTGKFAFVPHTRPNAILQFRFNANTGKLTANDPPKLQRKKNIGPRHLWFHPNNRFAFGSDEQGSSVTAYRLEKTGCLLPIETLSTLPPAGHDGRNSTSDIEVHPSGKFVYVANRGHNSIAGFSIDGQTGSMKKIQNAPCEATTRSFNISPDGQFLIGAGQSSGKAAVFQIDENGKLKRTSTIELGVAPWWVQFLDR